MSTVLEFAKYKRISLISCTINGKKCWSAYSRTREKEKCLPNLGKLCIAPRNKVLKMTVDRTNVESKSPIRTETKRSCTATNIIDGEYRKNALNIQMLSKSLHRQIFGATVESDQTNPELIQKAKEQLKEHGLLSDEINDLKDVELCLPPLRGKNIEEHFWSIGEEQCKPYRDLVNSFIKTGIPDPPSEWLCQKGWTKYVEGKEPVLVPFPDDDILIFDTEVCIRLGELPTLATAVSPNAWYGWVCSDLAEGIDSIPRKFYSTNMLIPFEGSTVNKEKPRLIVGHNVSYDRARIREQYYLKSKQSALHFLDTMSLHTCIGGLCKTQKIKLASDKTPRLEDDIGKELFLCSLKDLYNLYCEKHLNKEQRNTFVEGLMPDVKKDFQNLMKYCATDVKATYEVLQVIFPIFLKRFSHPVTLAGMLEMGSGFLPVNQNWNKFLVEAEQTYEDLKSEISSILSEKCNNACRLLYNEEYKKDLWMWSENWTTQSLKLTKKKPKQKVNENEDVKKCQQQEEEEDPEETELQKKYQYLFDLGQVLPVRLPFLPGYPQWYRKLCERLDSPNWTLDPQLTTSMYITPKLLNLTWENFPLYHTQEYGWGILIPDLFAENVETSIPFEKLKELTIKNCNIDLPELEQEMLKRQRKKDEKSAFPVPYYTGAGIWCNHVVDNCCYFFKIPHKNGSDKNVGNPLSKDIGHIFASGVLSSSDSNAEKVLDMSGKITYWRNSRQRITNQMVVWLNKKEVNTLNGSEEDCPIGVIIPKVVVCGTLTRRAMEATWLTASRITQNRIGSELRSMIQAPPGYHFVGADVDSQELWIASLIGDSRYAQVHGSTPLGWMTLSGTKPSGTDMHSVTAKAVGISRDQAKVINYARIYGAGSKFAEKLLKQFNPSMSDLEAKSKAKKMYRLTKGIKEFKVKKDILRDFVKTFGPNLKIRDLSNAAALARKWNKNIEDVFEKSQWVNGTESAMFNQLEKIATSSKPVTPFLQCRLSRALEPRFDGDDLHLKTRINWVVQSGAVDFLHLMLVCMKWLTNGKARYCFSFHDEVRYMIPSEERYNGALALHITNLLVRSFCTHRLGMRDLPQSVAFFSSVEIDKCLRKEANDRCITPSNPHGIETEYGIGPGESLNIYETIEKTGRSLAPFGTPKKRAPALSPTPSSQKSEEFKTEMSEATKRKYVHREILHGVLVPPTENQQIVRVLGSRGSNLHEVETPESTTFLASMPSKFRKNVWIKRGDYILVEPIEEGGKVKAEIVNILTADYIKYLKKESIWPSEFSKKTEEEATNSNDDFFVNNNRQPIFSEKETLE